MRGRIILQMPDSRPMLKQLASLLNDTHRTEAGVHVSMGLRTFIVPDQNRALCLFTRIDRHSVQGRDDVLREQGGRLN